eukprot:3169129-Rhodomonas_salina.1
MLCVAGSTSTRVPRVPPGRDSYYPPGIFNRFVYCAANFISASSTRVKTTGKESGARIPGYRVPPPGPAGLIAADM